MTDGIDAVRKAMLAAVKRQARAKARFALATVDRHHTQAVAASLAKDLAPFKPKIEQRAPDELLLTLTGFRIDDETAAFRAADALVAAYAIDAAEPEIFFTAMAIESPPRAPGMPVEEGITDLLGCWAGVEPGLTNKRWALEKMRVPEAWAFVETRNRPSRGEGIVIAQPDTGITKHAELAGIKFVSPRSIIGIPSNNATDPMKSGDNPGHGTSTASVVVSPETLDVSGTAPRAKHMPVRCIESVARLSQIKVAEAIDYAVENGAHVITMSLGGIASFSLFRALTRAVDAGVIVLAAAGNCVSVVVWPARYDKCIAVAGVNSIDQMWQGSCSGSAVDISAPAQNVYRASAREKNVGQGEGTSYAVALAAGVAACWLAFHGRAAIATEARQRNETVQDMFRRLLKATARVPAGWDSFNLGAGIVDAAALLAADLDLGLGTEGPTVPIIAESPGRSVRSLAFEKLGSPAVDADLDWQRHGAEISLNLLRRRGAPAPTTAEEATAILESLSPPQPPAPAPAGAPVAGAPAGESVAAPAVLRPLEEAPITETLRRQKRIIQARAAIEESGGGFLESTGVTDEATAAGEPLTEKRADATLERVLSLAGKMPANEVGDKQAFATALDLLASRGSTALKKLVGDDQSAAASVTTADHAALEAIIMADGSRPSFLVADGEPPTEHPFMGTWQSKVTSALPALKTVCGAVGRIQPRFGHAGNFIGTGCLVDAEKGIAITNFHVLDDARAKFGVLMEEKKKVVRIHGWMEIDFLGEASSFDTRRFRVVEAKLPKNAGRGFGRLDAVTLKIEPLDGAEMPKAMKFDRTPATFMQATSATLCTVGFPGPPLQNQGPKGEVDWNFVIRTLFGNLFGVKRFAPGRAGQVTGIELDTLNIVFGHEATTFGGASGSAMIAWENDGAPAFGLHFSGATEVSNYAISTAKAAEALAKIGVPF
jgi:serine protease